MFDIQEKNRRFDAFQRLMEQKDLAALLGVGNGCVGTNAYGCFRYMTNTRVYYHLQAVIFLPGKEPTGFVTSLISRREMEAGGFITDFRIGADTPGGMVRYLKEEGITRGRVGTCLDILPQDWYETIQNALPELELVDVAEDIFCIRNHHSREEIEIIRQCGALADAGYAEVLKNVKAGMTEQQVAAELEHAIQRMGGEYNFTLISSGPFSLTDNGLPCIRAATMFNREIQPGDCIAMEITPRYEGYWTQLVRTVSVGPPNEDFIRIHGVCCKIIQETLRELRPGNRIGNIALRIRELTEAAGFVFALPCGHICGNDLNEERIAPDNDRLLEEGMVVILHPSVITPQISSGIFWGQTYLITEDGYERLMKCGDEIMCI